MLLQQSFVVVVILCSWCFNCSIQYFNLNVAIVVCMLLQQLFGVCCNTMCYGVSPTLTYCCSSMYRVIALSCILCCSIKRMRIGYGNELAASGSTRGWQGEGRGGPHARGGGDGLLVWGSERRMVLRAYGVSEVGASWLAGSGRRAVLHAERVGWGWMEFPFLFIFFSMWCGWMAWCPDVLLAPNVRALVVPFFYIFFKARRYDPR